MSFFNRRFSASLRGYQLLAETEALLEDGKKVLQNNDNENKDNQNEDEKDEDYDDDLKITVDDKSRLFPKSLKTVYQPNNYRKYLFLIFLLLGFFLFFYLTFYFSSSISSGHQKPIMKTTSLSLTSKIFNSFTTSTATSTSSFSSNQQVTSTSSTSSPNIKKSTNSYTNFNQSKYLINTPTCKIPFIPPFTPETKPLFQRFKNKEYKCPPDDGTSAIKRVNFTWVSVPVVGCKATVIERNAANEGYKWGRTVTFGNRKLVNFPQADAVKVVCPLPKLPKATRILPLIPVKKPLWQKLKQKLVDTENTTPEVETNNLDDDDLLMNSRFRPNILAIGIDSISRLNYLRHFTQMQEFIAKVGTSFEGPLYGLQKIGDNTFPNLIGMFTGRTSWNITSSLPPSRKLDEVPLIFKDFSAAGYLTTYIENMPNFGLWTYHQKNGFGKVQPLEYLLRPVNMLVYKEMKNDFCYKDRLEMELYYDYLLDQMRAFRERNNTRFLTFIHMGAISHDRLNNAQYADGPMTRFMKDIWEEGFQKDTVIIFYSDHGIRFGKITQTDSGFQESRMPFMYFHIPERLKLKTGSGRDDEWLNSSELRKVFRANSRRLTSQFDVHATLRHLLDGVPPTSGNEAYGRSFFTLIPLNRTCEEAGIPDQYCVCSPFTPLTEKNLISSLAEYVISYLNGRLKPYAKKCATLLLDVVLKAKMSSELSEKSSILRFNSTLISKRRFFMRIRMLPSKGSVEMILQGNVVKSSINDTYTLNGSSLTAVSGVVRLDRYNEQSRCVANTNVESFCYCKNLLTN